MFKIHLTWNLISFFFVGLSGVALNILITHRHGYAGLGLFNQVYAAYIVLSQFSTAGLQLAVLQRTGRFQNDLTGQLETLRAGLLLTLMPALLVTGLAALVLRALPVSETGTAFLQTLPGLFFFSINKVFISFYNGRNDLKLFAVLQTCRSFFLLAAAVLLLPGSVTELCRVFSYSEAALFIVLIVTTLMRFRVWGPFSRAACRDMIAHGLKGFGGNAVSEINSRADVLILSLFVGKTPLGIYSFAAMFAEGFQLLGNLLANLFSPQISRNYYLEKNGFAENLRVAVKKSYGILGGLGLSGLILYPLLLQVILPGKNIAESWAVFSIILAGRVAAGGYLPLQMILNQTGFPGQHSLFLSVVLLINVAGTFALAPFWGIYGAALAVGLSAAAQALVLKRLVFKKLDLKI